MTFRISTTLPKSGTVTLTEVYRANQSSGPFAILDVVSGTPPRDDQGRFIYEDYSGDVSKFYRVVFYDAAQVILADSGPFSPNTVGSPDLGLLKKLDHNVNPTDGTFLADAMRYCGESGAGLADVPIRVYRAADFDAFRTDLALAVTRTDDHGRWVAPVFVSPGMQYCVLFYKEGLYGPDVVRITL